MKNYLSDSAKLILEATLAAMQNADELGGVESDNDYVLLMTLIAREANHRVDVCLANKICG